MPQRTTAAPASCAADNDSRSQIQAATVATTGSSIAVTPTCVAVMCRIAPTMSVNGTAEPSTITQSTRAQTGRWYELRCPCNETVRPVAAAGKLHHGWTTVQKTTAKKKPQA